MKTIRSHDNTLLIIEPKTDFWIYKSPRSKNRIEGDYRKGDDLYTHVTKEGRRFFYLISWVQWQRDENESYREITEKEVVNFLLEKRKEAGKIGLDPDIIDRIERFFPELFKK